MRNGNVAGGARPRGSGVSEGILSLARHLLILARQQRASGSGAVLLDVIVDGARCRIEELDPNSLALSDSLSPREREVAGLVAQGYTSRMIARQLDISVWTVNSHLRRAFEKLGVQTRAEMVARVRPILG